MVAQTINDLKTCFDAEFDMPELAKARQVEKQNLLRAEVLETEFKQLLSGVPEYMWEKEVIWSASDPKVTPLFLKFSTVFDFSRGALTELELLQAEENMLNVVEKAIVFCETNDIQGKEMAFSNILDAKEQIQGLKDEMKLKHLKHHSDQIWQERQKGISHEKE